MKYQICPWCGNHLDFGEKCDCMKTTITNVSEEINTSKGERDLYIAISQEVQRKDKLF